MEGFQVKEAEKLLQLSRALLLWLLYGGSIADDDDDDDGEEFHDEMKYANHKSLPILGGVVAFEWINLNPLGLGGQFWTYQG